MDLSKPAFLSYCKRGFELFFDNPSHSISTSSLIDIMLENKMKETHVRDFVSYADDDASGTVDYSELLGVLIR